MRIPGPRFAARVARARIRAVVNAAHRRTLWKLLVVVAWLVAAAAPTSRYLRAARIRALVQIRVRARSLVAVRRHVGAAHAGPVRVALHTICARDTTDAGHRDQLESVVAPDDAAVEKRQRLPRSAPVLRLSRCGGITASRQGGSGQPSQNCGAAAMWVMAETLVLVAHRERAAGGRLAAPAPVRNNNNNKRCWTLKT